MPMLNHPEEKYVPFTPIDLPDRRWPGARIERAPRWCSSDLRDGNQALINPMDQDKKSRFYDLLLRCGFREIEIGFPSASQTEFDFVRSLIEENRIPADVWPQVLVQARADLIARTFDSLRGAPRAVVHLYNATSPLFRQVVFQADQAAVKQIAVAAAQEILAQAQAQPETDWRFEYSPETFSTTELDFALEVCEAVLDVWAPTPDRPVILNLPATVEAATPNVYADQIEWFCRHISRRDAVVISVHPHNDRGTGVAAAELAVMAGADRVEGCLFGNGERTGNVDLVTLALNLYSQGVAPGLDFSNIRDVVATVERCNDIAVHPRHPYAGELVFTAFSGSHQDAIKKGFAAQARRNDTLWAVPYLPIDPADIGCGYEAVIRVNSQSGKGGVAWVLEQERGLKLPRAVQIDFSRRVQDVADALGREVTGADVWDAFRHAYRLDGPQRIVLEDYEDVGAHRPGARRRFVGRLTIDGVGREVRGHGVGLISSAVAALRDGAGIELEVTDYSEHALGHGADARAVAYVQCRTADGRVLFGVGIDDDVGAASVRAVISAANG